MDPDLQNIAFCLAMWAVPFAAIHLSNRIDRKAAQRPARVGVGDGAGQGVRLNGADQRARS